MKRREQLLLLVFLVIGACSVGIIELDERPREAHDLGVALIESQEPGTCDLIADSLAGGRDRLESDLTPIFLTVYADAFPDRGIPEPRLIDPFTDGVLEACGMDN